MKPHPIDELFEKQLRHHEEVPSAMAWQQLQKQLGHEKKGLIWDWRIAAVIAVLFCIGLTVWYVPGTKQTSPSQQAVAVTKSAGEVNPTLKAPTQAPVLDNKTAIAATKEEDKTPVQNTVDQHNTEKKLKAQQVAMQRMAPIKSLSPQGEGQIAMYTPAAKQMTPVEIQDVRGIEIVYIRTETSQEKESDWKQLSKFGSKLKRGAATTFADIRQAKNDIFNWN